MTVMLNSQQKNGFTVVEVMVGIALFGLIMPTIILAVVGVSRLNDRAADLTRANVVAEEKMESLRNKGYNSLSTGTVDFESELDQSFTKPRTATYTVSNPTTGVKEIAVVIQYTDQGETRALNFKTIISELGVAQ